MSLFLTLLFSYQYSISHQSHTIGTTCAVFSWMTGLILLVTWTWWQSQLAFYRSLIVYTLHRCHKLSAVLVEGGGEGGGEWEGGWISNQIFKKGALTGPLFLEEGCWEREGWLFLGVVEILADLRGDCFWEGGVDTSMHTMSLL